jgi:hypothetical protein
VPTAGSSQRSTPHQPAVFQAIINNMLMANITGLVLAVPAIMKFQFMNAPAKAEMPTNTPAIRAMPITTSLTATSLPNHT